MEKLLLPFEWKILAGESRNVHGDWKHEGVILPQTEEWEDDFATLFPSSIIRAGETTRFYYSLRARDKPERECAGIALAEKQGGIWKKHLLSSNPADYFSMAGIPENCRPIQPVVVRLSDREWRMYFWIHGPGVCRFLAAHSINGLNWRVGGSPLLYHYPGDAESKFHTARSSNDATTVYCRHDKTFEFYSAAKTFAEPGSPHYIEKDHAGGCIRIIQRWTSPDGIKLDNPEVILMPDELDPPDLQFYYLACLEVKNYRFGFAGHYRVEEQKMYLELVYSTDGSHWERPFRGNCFPLRNPEESYGIYAAAGIYLDGPVIHMPYTSTNAAHNLEACSEERPKNRICSASIPLHRLFGRQVSNGVLLSPPLRILAPSQIFSFNANDILQLDIMDAYGEKILAGREIAADGNGQYRLDYPEEIIGKVVRFKLTGTFILYIFGIKEG